MFDKNRQQKVSKFELLAFPNNCIGRIFINKKLTQENVTATGFLISSSLVLTSAHPFEKLSSKLQVNEVSDLKF